MSNRLHVGNLSFRTTLDSLRVAFEPHGQVTDVHVVTDRESGQSRGFGFVTMGDKDAATRAIEAMHGSMLDGRPLRVTEAEERRSGGGGDGGGGRRGERGRR